MSKRTIGNTRHQGVDAETANHAARRIALALLHGNALEAHSIVDTALATRNPRRSRKDLLRLPVSQIGLELRVSNALERRGVRTVEQLLCTTRSELLTFANLGTSALAQIICAVRDLGFIAEEETEDESA